MDVRASDLIAAWQRRDARRLSGAPREGPALHRSRALLDSSHAGNDLPVQIFQEGERVSFGRPAMNATSSRMRSPEYVIQRNGRGVLETVCAVARGSLKEIVRGNLQGFDQRILYRLET